ncbi:amino acid permease [Lactobacillus sp. ESL0791]|uniref:APC family permease n=1 Tax=Lactobacillus sp. ESL0791 TaxID=2983234 RepID=UPI0023F86CDC|nr:amino acid permease [Lactobacillus sp. ESL0791]MDF7639244.1 amino acid permease [Lactobacillus sp. ESL0791]
MKNNESEDPELKHTIGVFGGSNILIGIMIGSGIFYIGSYVLERSNMSMGYALLAWLLAGLVTLLGSLCFAELGAMNPATGGIYVYLSDAFSPVVGYMFTFQSIVIGGPGSIAAIAIALPMALKTFFAFDYWTVKLLAIGLIVVFTIINYFGVNVGQMVQNFFTVLKVLPLVIIIGLGIFWGKFSPDLSLSMHNAGTNNIFSLISMVSFAVIASLWAYEGWTNLNTVAGEMKNPQKNLPKALILSVGFTTLVYTLFNFAIYRSLSPQAIHASLKAGKLYLGTDVAETFMGTAGILFVAIAMVLAMASSLNGMVLAFSRYYYAVSKDGLLWKTLGHIHPKYKTPDHGLFMQMTISILLVLTRNLDQLTSLVVFSGAIFNLLSILAVPVLRWRKPDATRPYKVWAYPWTVIIAALAFLLILANNFLGDPVTSLLGLVIPGLGSLAYCYFRHKYPQKANK